MCSPLRFRTPTLKKSLTTAKNAVQGRSRTPAAGGAVEFIGAGNQDTNARDLLSKVAATYRNLNSFEWAALSTFGLDSADAMPITTPLVGAFRRPHSMRLDWHGEGQPSDSHHSE
jgi:hypothetical protein